jgi:hypothetical protein
MCRVEETRSPARVWFERAQDGASTSILGWSSAQKDIHNMNPDSRGPGAGAKAVR